MAWIENDVRASIEDSLKKEFNKSLNNLKKDIEWKNPVTPNETAPEDQWWSTKQEILNQNRDLFDKFFQNSSNSGNGISRGNWSHEQYSNNSRAHNERVESNNNLKLWVDRELGKEFDKLNINRQSLWHIASKRFSNINARWTYTEFGFNKNLEQVDENGHTYVEINWIKFYQLIPQKGWIIYKWELISDEELKYRTDIMHTYTRLERQAWWEKFSTVEIWLQRGLCSSWIQFCGTWIWRTNWNRLTDKNGNFWVYCKKIRENKTTII